ncbi:MAG: peptide deformylase [Phenylobacterium sp.]
MAAKTRKQKEKAKKKNRVALKTQKMEYHAKIRKSIITFDNDILFKECSLIKDKAHWEELNNIYGDIVKKMKTVLAVCKNGAGLAAPQIGISFQVVVVKPFENKHHECFAMINPVIVSESNVFEYGKEGCLSFPDYYKDVARPDSIKVKYLDENFTEIEEEFTGYGARVILHEIEHLQGKPSIGLYYRETKCKNG